VPGNEISGGPFTPPEQAVIAAIRERKIMDREGRSEAAALVARGLVNIYDNGPNSLQLNEDAIAESSQPLPVWLPNTLIDGADNEVPPVELLRQTRSAPALRLLVELYESQFLPHYGGVPLKLLRVEYGRLHVGERGPFVVWGFQKKCLTAGYNLARQFLTGKIVTREDGTRHDSGWDEYFFPAVHTLETLGLIERVGMLLDGDDPEAEIIHPCGINGGEPAERELARVAHEAAAAMVTEGQLRRSEFEEHYDLVPVQRHIANVTLVEVLRLRYRPHTTATAAWYAQMKESTAEWLARYRAIISDRANRQWAA
jgi:hypothetical protein